MLANILESPLELSCRLVAIPKIGLNKAGEQNLFSRSQYLGERNAKENLGQKNAQPRKHRDLFRLWIPFWLIMTDFMLAHSLSRIDEKRDAHDLLNFYHDLIPNNRRIDVHAASESELQPGHFQVMESTQANFSASSG